MQRPAEQLVASIDKQIKAGGDVTPPGTSAPYRLISIAMLQNWRKLARSIDARMRLDGSPKNRRKKAKS